MKFDQTLKAALFYTQTSQNKIFLAFLKYYLHLLLWKKRKLELGRIQFTMQTVYVGGVIPVEKLCIKYMHQDDEITSMDLTNLTQKFFFWKWDWLHICSLLIAGRFIYTTIKFYLLNFINTKVLVSAQMPLAYSIINKLLLTEMFNMVGNVTGSRGGANQWFVDVLIDFCSFFNIFF